MILDVDRRMRRAVQQGRTQSRELAVKAMRRIPWILSHLSVVPLHQDLLQGSVPLTWTLLPLVPPGLCSSSSSTQSHLLRLRHLPADCLDIVDRQPA